MGETKPAWATFHFLSSWVVIQYGMSFTVGPLWFTHVRNKDSSNSSEKINSNSIRNLVRRPQYRALNSQKKNLTPICFYIGSLRCAWINIWDFMSKNLRIFYSPTSTYLVTFASVFFFIGSAIYLVSCASHLLSCGSCVLLLYPSPPTHTSPEAVFTDAMFVIYDPWFQ